MSKRREHREARIEQEEYHAPRESAVKQTIILLAVAFVVTLGVVVGTRMSSDAIAVLVGVIAGVAASIPCALLLMAVTRRQQAEDRAPDADPHNGRYDGGYEQRPAPPPVIVVTSGSAAPQQIAPWCAASGQAEGMILNPYAYGSAQPQGRREFRVMGYEESEEPVD